jgi:hypothetical protein
MKKIDEDRQELIAGYMLPWAIEEVTSDWSSGAPQDAVEFLTMTASGFGVGRRQKGVQIWQRKQRPNAPCPKVKRRLNPTQDALISSCDWDGLGEGSGSRQLRARAWQKDTCVGLA